MSNTDLESMVDTTDEWIFTRTGIRERRIARADEAGSDLAFVAAGRALENAGIRAEDLDGIIVGTISGDMPFPATACILQNRLGATNAAAFDLAAACSGFVYAAVTAHSMIATGQMNKVLVVGVEILSKIVDWQDRTTCVLFGDGAGAVVMEAADHGTGLLGTYMKSDGGLADILYIPSGGSREPASMDTLERRGHFIKMKGDGVFKYAVRAMEDAAMHVLNEAGLGLGDVDMLIAHQANIRIIDAVAKRLGLPEDKVVANIARYGNTSSATIPIALDEVVREGRLKPGDLCLMVAFGGGLTWGAVLFRHA